MEIIVTWRDVARPVIRQTLKQTQGNTYREIRSSLRKMYPFEKKQGYCYQVWLDEINRQMKRGKYEHKQGLESNELTLF